MCIITLKAVVFLQGANYQKSYHIELIQPLQGGSRDVAFMSLTDKSSSDDLKDSELVGRLGASP